MGKVFLCFISVLCIIVGIPIMSCAESVNNVVAVVNGVSLGEPELNQEISLLVSKSQSFHGKISDEKMKKIRAEAIKNLVDLELQAQDAGRKGIVVTSEVLVEEINKQAAKFQAKEGLVEAYKRAGFSEASYKRLIERRLLAEKIKYSEVDEKLTVTPEKVNKYYLDNILKYSKPEQFRASHILLKVDPSSTKEERSLIHNNAKNILKRIKKGEKFEDIAMKESDDLSKIKGGDLGYFYAGQTEPEFEIPLKKLKVGGTSGIVESMYGYQIIKLTERRAPQQIPFDEIKEKVTKDFMEAENKLLLSKLMDKIYKTAIISYPGAHNE